MFAEGQVVVLMGSDLFEQCELLAVAIGYLHYQNKATTEMALLTAAAAWPGMSISIAV